MVTITNSSSPGQNVGHFTDDISKSILMNENFHILIKMQCQAIIWIKAGPVYQCIYAALVGDQLTHYCLVMPFGAGDLGQHWYKCCLMVPSHYLNQYLFIISRLLCHSPKNNGTMKIITTSHLKITWSKSKPHLKGPWVKWMHFKLQFSRQMKCFNLILPGQNGQVTRGEITLDSPCYHIWTSRFISHIEKTTQWEFALL